MPREGLENAGLCTLLCKISTDSFEEGDLLAVIYDDHWWLAESMDVDKEHQGVRVEFIHPCGPTANVHPKHGRRDVCFCSINNILLKLTGKASPLQISRIRELYTVALI